MTELISSALNFMRLSFDQSLAKLGQSAFHRRIITAVTNLNDQAPDEAGISGDIEDRRGPGHCGEPVTQGLQLILIKGHGRPHLHRKTPVAAVPGGACLTGDDRKQVEPFVPVQDTEEPKNRLRRSILKELGENPVLVGRRNTCEARR